MKLDEIVSLSSPGNKTNLSGGNIPNVYKSDSTKASKKPRKKHKDTYGIGGDKSTSDSLGSGGGE